MGFGEKVNVKRRYMYETLLLFHRPQEASLHGDAAKPAQHDQSGHLEQAPRVGLKKELISNADICMKLD